MKAPRFLACVFALVGLACGVPALPAGPADAPAPKPLAAERASAAPVERSNAAEAAPSEVALGIRKLVERVANECKREGDKLASCSALRDLLRERELFETTESNDILLAMLESPDEIVRIAAAYRVGARKLLRADLYFASRDRALRLFQIARREDNAFVAGAVGRQAAFVDAEKLGLARDLAEIAARPVPSLRAALTDAYRRNPTMTNLEMVRRMLDDPDVEVHKEAIKGLSFGAVPTPELCRLLTVQLASTEASASTAAWAGAWSDCEGILEPTLRVIDDRTARPVDPNEESFYLRSAIERACERRLSQRQRRQLVRAARAMTNAAIWKSAYGREQSDTLTHTCHEMPQKPVGASGFEPPTLRPPV